MVIMSCVNADNTSILFPLFLWEVNLTRHTQTHAGPFMSAHPHVFDCCVILQLLCCCCCDCGHYNLCRWQYIFCHCVVLFTLESVHQSYRVMAVISMTSLWSTVWYHMVFFFLSEGFMCFLHIKMVLTLSRPLRIRLISLLI